MIGSAGVQETLQLRREELLERAERARDEAARAEIAQIDTALARLERGEYGVCVLCGNDIEMTRLAAVPYADRCQSCVGH